jgi:hypothetical protein
MTARYFLLEYTTHRLLEDRWHEPTIFCAWGRGNVAVMGKGAAGDEARKAA